MWVKNKLMCSPDLFFTFLKTLEQPRETVLSSLFFWNSVVTQYKVKGRLDHAFRRCAKYNLAIFVDYLILGLFMTKVKHMLFVFLK